MEKDDTATVISIETYNSIANKVFDYMLAYSSDNDSIEHNFTQKRDHTNRVIGYTEVLTRDLHLNNDMVLAAQLTALLHDIGRFEQFKQFQTFNDSISFDHAQKAVELIDEKQWLSDLPDEFQNMIKKAIQYHNKIVIPKEENELVMLMAKIIRDADKTDILDIAIKEFSLQTNLQNPSFALNLEKKLTFSKKVSKAIIAGEIANKADLKTVNDFKLMLMGYVFDINFKKTFATINQRQYLKQLFDTLPKSDDIFEVFRKTKIHVENQLI